MKRALFIAIYLGFGMLWHVAMIGTIVDWSSAWSLALIFAWPALLLAVIMLAGLILIAIDALCIGALMLTEWIRRKA